MSDTTITDEMKCLSLIEVMGMPIERREIALGVLLAIKQRDEWRKCAERLAAIVGANENEFHLANDIDLALEEFNQLKNKYE
jgi:hypothetical protein